MLVDIDETSYEGGTNGARHPMSWYHAYDGGRAFYTNMGHTEATFSEPLFLRHLLGGLRYAMGTAPLSYGRARPEENRFTKVVLTEKLNEAAEKSAEAETEKKTSKRKAEPKEESIFDNPTVKQVGRTAASIITRTLLGALGLGGRSSSKKKSWF